MTHPSIPGTLDEVRTKWRIDKSVSGQTVIIVLLSFIGASFVNFAALVWLARGVVADQQESVRMQTMDRARITALEVARQEDVLERIRNASRMAVLEDRSINTHASVLRIEADVRRLVEARNKHRE